MRFTKAHGTANDFVVFDDWQHAITVTAELARAVCDRRVGVGADGLIRLTPGTDGADVVMEHWNADGSRPEVCGNGLRVVAKHVVDHSLVQARHGDTVVVATGAGHRTATLEFGNDGRVATVTVDMGVPVLDAAGEVEVEVGGTTVRLTSVSMGNPHAVLVVDDVEAADVAGVGAAIEHHSRFPDGTNVEFAQVIDPGRVRLRVWERGVGETAACGTGACATVVALQRAGLVGDDVEVAVRGGTLRIRHEAGGTVRLSGPAVEVAVGELDDRWLDALASAGA